MQAFLKKISIWSAAKYPLTCWVWIKHPPSPRKVEFDKFSCADRPFLYDRDFSGARKDEIGRVGHALVSMMQRMNRMLTGQRQFIRYVAHELNMPLAKAQMGLGVLECKLTGDERLRVRQVLKHIKCLSVLTEEVLAYLQAKASMPPPRTSL